MKPLRIWYTISIIVLLYSIFKSPKSDIIGFDFILLLLLTVGSTILIAPYIMINKAKKFYDKAKKEGRTRGEFDRGPAPVEEEYRNDIMILTFCLSILYLLLAYWNLK